MPKIVGVSAPNKVAALPSTADIKDPMMRTWAEAMTSAWQVRNGGGGASGEEFIRRADMTDLAGQALIDLLRGAASPEVVSGVGGASPGTYDEVLKAVSQLVLSSRVVEYLRTPFTLINPPTDRLKKLLDTVKSGLANEVELRLEGDAVINDRIDTLEATSGDASAAVTAEATARANADTALAATLSSVSASVGTAHSDIAAELVARANADSSLASSISTVSTGLGTVSAAQTSEITTRSNKDNSLAQAINTLWASIGGAAALIQDGALAAVSPAAVSATKWLQVQAAVTDPATGLVNSASIKQELNAYASAANNTFNATYGVRLNVNGVISGFSLMATTGAGSAPGSVSSTFAILADRLALVSPSNVSVVPFTVDGSGNGVFSGWIYAAGGVFGGALSAATGSFAGSLSAATGSFAGSLTAATGTFSGTLTAAAVSAVNTINIAGNAVSVAVGAIVHSYSSVSVTVTVASTDIPSGFTTVPILVTASSDTSSAPFFDIGYNQSDLTQVGNRIAALPPAGVCSMQLIENVGAGTHTFSFFNHSAPFSANAALRTLVITATLGKR